MKYLLLLLLTTSFCFAQEFKQDWKDFKVPSNWTMEFKKDLTLLPFLGKNTLGTITFINKNYPDAKILYYVFTAEDIDDSFIKKIDNWYLVQSCLIEIGKNKPFRSSFESKKYFYTIKPCYKCSITNNNDCKELADKIFDFVSAKNKWTTLDN